MGQFDFIETELGLQRQKSSIPLSFAGQYNGYYTVIEMNSGPYGDNRYTIRVSYRAQAEADPAIKDLMNTLSTEHKFNGKESTGNLLSLFASVPIGRKKLKKRILTTMSLITERFQSLGLEAGDFYNGDVDDGIALYQLSNRYVYLSRQNYQLISHDLQREEQEAAERNESPTILAGLGGALLGALIGAIAWGLLLYLGYYAWFAGILGTALAFHFYEKRNGLISVKGSIIVTMLVLLMLVLANILTYSIVMLQTLRSYGANIQIVLANFPYLLKELGLSQAFALDMFLGIGIAIIFSVFMAYRIYVSSKNKNKISPV